MHQVDLACDVGKIERFLDRGIAAADDRHVLVTEEEPVAGGAGGHALAHELLFRFDAQVLRAGPGGDDQRVRRVLATIALELERTARQVGRVDVVEDDFGLEALGVCLHARHQVRAHQPVGVARPVVDLGGGHQLAALLQAGDEHGLEVGARRVDGGGVTGGAGSEDEQLGVLGGGHWRLGPGEGGDSTLRAASSLGLALR